MKRRRSWLWAGLAALSLFASHPAYAENAPLPDWMQRVHIGGNAAMRFMTGQSRAELEHNDGFMVYQADIVFDIDVTPDLSFWYDADIIREGAARFVDVPFQQIYARWDSILHQNWLNAKIGRTFVPFGEEYLRFDAIDNPLASPSVADVWGVDEGVVLFGALLPKDRLSYSIGVQNGNAAFNAADKTGKSVAVKLGSQALPWLYVSGSYLNLGRRKINTELGASEIWVSGFEPKPLGPTTADSGASPSADIEGHAMEGDLRLTAADLGRLSFSAGYVRLQDGGGAPFNRVLHYYTGEIVAFIPKTAGKAYVASRYSIIGTMNHTLGYHFAGTELAYQGLGNNSSPYDALQYNQRDLERASLGIGYRFHPNAVIKVEYSWEGTHLIDSDRTAADLAELGQRNFFITELAFRF